MVKGMMKTRQNRASGKFEIISEGKENRDRIFNFIYKNREEGARPRDIINDTKLSKETVHNHLQVLLSDKRIYKKNRRYYPEISIQNAFIEFGSLMSEGYYNLIDRELIETGPDAKIPLHLVDYARLKLHQKVKVNLPDKILSYRDLKLIKGNMYLMKMLLGPITSEKYCITRFGPKESLEKCLFEFSNRIGAYITYIFLQSLFPLRESKLNDNDRSELCKKMIENAISTEDLFIFFRSLMTELGLTNCNLESREYERLFELSDFNFNAISKGFQNVYPNLYIGFENWWLHATLNTLAVDASIMKSSSCDHEWEKKYLFKYGLCFHCKKCHNLSDKLPKRP
jgi:hypothetical protein